jgi:hypothetical protein
LFSEVGNSSQVLCVQEFAEVLESLREAIDLVGGKSEVSSSQVQEEK